MINLSFLDHFSKDSVCVHAYGFGLSVCIRSSSFKPDSSSMNLGYESLELAKVNW
jgi:hypothetical protein